MLSTWVIGAFLACIAYYFWSRPARKYPPGPFAWPILGCLFEMDKHPNLSYEKWTRKYGPIFYVRIASMHSIVLSDTKLITECFNDSRFQSRPSNIITSLLSDGPNGVILSSGKTWSEQRRFTLRHLRDFGFGKNIMENLILDEVNDVLEAIKKESSTPVALEEKFSVAAINALWTIVAGKRFKHDDAEKLQLMKDLHDRFTKIGLAIILYMIAPKVLSFAPRLTGFDRVLDVVERVRRMLTETIKEHEQTLPDEMNPRDLIDSFLFEIKKTSDPTSSFHKENGYKQLIAVISDLFFAGTETISATLTWGMLYLAKDQERQEKLVKQLHKVTGNTRPVSLADKLSLPYAEATMMEILRCSTVAGQGLMHTPDHDTTFHGYDVPRGTYMISNLYTIHRDPKIWGDPENFRPERFLNGDETSVVKNPNLIPFSVGKRVCLGESLARDQLFLFTTNIFQRFHLKLNPNEPPPNMLGEPGGISKPCPFTVIVTERV